MKIGFNEGCNRFCENHSVLEDLDLCEKYGFDYIDIQSECLDREIAAGKYTIDDLAAWFADPAHKLRMLSYNALVFFNMKQTQEEKDAVMAKHGPPRVDFWSAVPGILPQKGRRGR